MKKLILSLVVTAHRKEYLAEALISVANQSDKDYELVLCLDLNINRDLDVYCKQFYDNINCSKKRMLTISGNGTAGYCRNEAFRNTSGAWIAYLDGDDMLAPDAVETMKGAILDYPQYDIFSSGIIRINSKGLSIPMVESLYYYPPRNIYWVDPEVVGKPTYFNQFQVMRREVWEGYEYDINSNGEDIDFMLINLLKWKFKKISKYLYYYRDVEDSFSKELYKNGDFTTQRYLSGYYKKYYDMKYSKIFANNFKDDEYN